MNGARYIGLVGVRIIARGKKKRPAGITQQVASLCIEVNHARVQPMQQCACNRRGTPVASIIRALSLMQAGVRIHGKEADD